MGADVELAGRRVTVVGLGHFGGGVGAVRWLCAQGAQVTVTDLKPADQLADGLAAIDDLLRAGAVRLVLGEHRDADFTQAQLLVASPAVPPGSPLLTLARQAGVPISTELQLLIERLPKGVLTVGVTGSNGKSTTTALVAHLLRHLAPAAGIGQVWLGGNIGVSLLEPLPQIRPGDAVVLELSSFMLEAFALNGLRWSPQVAVVTNLTANHLDRHGTLAAYAEAKRQILAHQGPEDLAILNADDPTVSGWPAHARGQVLMFGESAHAWRLSPEQATAWPLPGAHNRANAAAALATCEGCRRRLRLTGAQADLLPALASFPGLPHRLEPVGEVAGVRCFNDSKATTPESAILALRSFTQPVVAIVGGSDKGIDLTPLARELAARAKAAVVMGAVREQLLAALRGLGPSACVVLPADTFADAVDAALRVAEPGDVVLLSPGCASYGMFSHYEQRGDAFRAAIRARQAVGG